jgi:hypothetical protein
LEKKNYFHSDFYKLQKYPPPPPPPPPPTLPSPRFCLSYFFLIIISKKKRKKGEEWRVSVVVDMVVDIGRWWILRTMVGHSCLRKRILVVV